MEEYTLLRQFADSWMLLLLFLFFVGIVFWVFRPGSSATYSDTANIPFRNADKPDTGEKSPAHKENRT